MGSNDKNSHRYNHHINQPRPARPVPESQNEARQAKKKEQEEVKREERAERKKIKDKERAERGKQKAQRNMKKWAGGCRGDGEWEGGEDDGRGSGRDGGEGSSGGGANGGGNGNQTQDNAGNNTMTNNEASTSTNAGDNAATNASNNAAPNTAYHGRAIVRCGVESTYDLTGKANTAMSSTTSNPYIFSQHTTPLSLHHSTSNNFHPPDSPTSIYSRRTTGSTFTSPSPSDSSGGGVLFNTSTCPSHTYPTTSSDNSSKKRKSPHFEDCHGHDSPAYPCSPTQTYQQPKRLCINYILPPTSHHVLNNTYSAPLLSPLPRPQPQTWNEYIALCEMPYMQYHYPTTTMAGCASACSCVYGVEGGWERWM